MKKSVENRKNNFHAHSGRRGVVCAASGLVYFAGGGEEGLTYFTHHRTVNHCQKSIT